MMTSNGRIPGQQRPTATPGGDDRRLAAPTSGRDGVWPRFDDGSVGDASRGPNNDNTSLTNPTPPSPAKQSHSPPQQRHSPPPDAGGVPAVTTNPGVGTLPGGGDRNRVVTPVTLGSGAGQGSDLGSRGVAEGTPEAQVMKAGLDPGGVGSTPARGASPGGDPVSSPEERKEEKEVGSETSDQKPNSRANLNSNTNANPSHNGNNNQKMSLLETGQQNPEEGDPSLLRPSQTYLSSSQEEKEKEDSTAPLEVGQIGGAAGSPEDLTYGWGSFRPQCLQFLNKPVWVVFFLCMAIVAESMATVGLVSITISTLETRFQLSSNQAGLIPSAYECAGLPALIISGYFGGNGHRPRWIAFGMLLLSLGSLLFALPHFLTEPYTADDGVLLSNSDNTCQLNQTSSYEQCSAASSEDLSHYLYVFMAGHTLHGIGGVPLYTLSLTYIDDIATRGTASVYIGVILSLTTLGPAIAFVGAGYLLELYTDLDVVDVSKVELTSSDPRWVGAWWIGFLVTFTLALVTVIPLAGFPKDMPGAAEHRKKRVTEVHDTGEDLDLPGVHPGVGMKSHDFPRAVNVLVRNPTFMFLTLVGAFQLFFLAGFGTFEPKYMENMFHVSPAMAGIITGLLGVPGGAAGSILASVLIKRLKMTSTQMLKWMFLLTIVIVFLNVIFLVQCDDVPFAGVNVPYSNSTDVISLLDSCNSQCGCSELAYEPVCGSNNMFYFSPCHAACQFTNISGQFENCGCIPSAGDVSLYARAEACTSSCNLLPIYSILFFLGIMLSYLTAMFHLLAVIRVVPDSQRSFAVSIDWFLCRLLGGILGPVAFGWLLDLTCVLWERKCDGSGSCLYYQNGSMGWYIFCMATVCMVACIFSSFMAWWKYKPPPAIQQPSSENVESTPELKTVTLEMNGVCPVKAAA